MKNYRLSSIQRSKKYRVPEIADLYRIHTNTVYLWIKRQGLPSLGKEKPYLIHGEDLYIFVKEMRNKRRCQLQKNEVFCCTCRRPRNIDAMSITLHSINQNQFALRGFCNVCGAQTCRFFWKKDCHEVEKNFGISLHKESSLTSNFECNPKCQISRKQ